MRSSAGTMRILITWGSKRGGTRDIARMLAEHLRQTGHQVDLLPPREAERAKGFDAAIVGGAVYAGLWHHAARRFVARREKDLRAVPVWFFSSGPLDESASRDVIPPIRQVQIFMERVGALGHATFGGKLSPDARGFPASALAKEHAGDFRDPDKIAAWAKQIAGALPTARPGIIVAQPGGSRARLVLHALAGWGLSAVSLAALLAATSRSAALIIHALAALVVFGGVSEHYFRKPGARDPLTTAIVFTAMVALLDVLVLSRVVQHRIALMASVAGFWVPLGLIFAVTWVTGLMLAMLPPAGTSRAAR